MITDSIPKIVNEKEEYFRSDGIKTLLLPPEEPSRTLAKQLEMALKADDKKAVQRTSTAIAVAFSEALQIQTPKVKVLGSRPFETMEGGEYELFGDYQFDNALIRLWMRTAVHERPTAYGTFLHTLCHELCHHLDVVSLKLPNTFHTRGFYERAGLLYHHLRGTPLKQLVWREGRAGVYMIDWQQTMRGSGK